MGMVTRSPFAWVEDKAMDFPSLWGALQRHHPWSHPVSYFMILTIFFEETGFCNIEQAGTKGNLGIGFGQLEISNPDKRPFYAWMGLPTDFRAVASMMLADKDLAVKVHCKYFQYLTSPPLNKSLEGCLDAQVGGHKTYKALFRQGEKMLREAFEANDRAAYIRALNHARQNSPKQNGISEKYFPDYWKYILPETWFSLGY